MSIQVSFNGSTLLLPGAYSRTQVEINPGNPFASSGIVGIVGEAAGGAPGTVDGVQTFAINQIYDIVQKYQSGQIVDAVRSLAEPGKDDAIPSGANLVRIYKTNASTRASSVVRNADGATTTTIFDVDSSNYGLVENQTNFYITEGSVPDAQASITSGVITLPLTLTSADTMVLNINGTAYTFTVPVGGVGPHATVAAVLAVLNNSSNWSPSKPVIATDATTTAGSAIKLTLDTTQSDFLAYDSRYEYIILYVAPSTGLTGADVDLQFRAPIAFASNGTSSGTFTVSSLGTLGGGLAVGQKAVVIDDNSSAVVGRITAISGTGPYTITLNSGTLNLSAFTTASNAAVSATYTGWSTSTLLTTAGPSGFVRGSRGNRVFVIRKNAEVETILENENNVLLRILYKGAGSAATLSVLDVTGVKRLQTSCTGASSDNLNINLTEFTTIRQLVDFINNFNSGLSYTCVSDFYNAAVASPTTLDYYDALDIRSMPLELKAAINEIVTNVNGTSQFIRLDRISNVYGQVETISSTARRFLSGGTRGASTNSSFQTGFDALLRERCNIVVPLVSSDASVDISNGITDPSSTYTILSIHAQADAHCRTASNTQNRSERNGFVGIKDTLANSILASKALNSEYISMAIQDVRTLNASGTVVWQDPWVFAALAAGMQAGSEVGTPLTHKYMNVIGIRHSDFDPKVQYNQAIAAGILFAQQPDAGGTRIVVGNTTYQKDQSFVFNRISVFEICNYVAYDSRIQLENAFIGRSRAYGTSLAVAVKTFFNGVLSGYTRAGLLAPDALNKGLGFREVTVVITGGVVNLSAIITPAPGIDFLLTNLTISQVSDAA